MSPEVAGTRTYNMFSRYEQVLKAGLAVLFKASSTAAAGYEAPVTWAYAPKYVKFLHNPGAPPRPVITYPAMGSIVKRADLRLDWTMSAGNLGPSSTVRCFGQSGVIKPRLNC